MLLEYSLEHAGSMQKFDESRPVASCRLEEELHASQSGLKREQYYFFRSLFDWFEERLAHQKGFFYKKVVNSQQRNGQQQKSTKAVSSRSNFGSEFRNKFNELCFCFAPNRAAVHVLRRFFLSLKNSRKILRSKPPRGNLVFTMALKYYSCYCTAIYTFYTFSHLNRNNYGTASKERIQFRKSLFHIKTGHEQGAITFLLLAPPGNFCEYFKEGRVKSHAQGCLQTIVF